MNASTSPLTAALAAAVDEASARLPNIKAPVDLLGLIAKFGIACHGEGRDSGRDPYFEEYGDRSSDEIWPQIVSEVERLQGIEYDYEEQRTA